MSKKAGAFIIAKAGSVHPFQSPSALFAESNSSPVETGTIYIPLQLSQDTRFNRVNNEAQTQAMNLDDSLCSSSEEENGQEDALSSSVCTSDQPSRDSSLDTTSMTTKQQTTPVHSLSLGLQQNSDSHQTTSGPKKVPCFGKKKNPRPPVSTTPVANTENSPANTKPSGTSEDPTSSSIGLTTSVVPSSEPVAVTEPVKKPKFSAVPKANAKGPCTEKAVADPSNPSSTSKNIPKKPRKVLSAEDKARNAAEREQKKLDKKKEIEQNRIEREWQREFDKAERQVIKEEKQAEREKMKKGREKMKEKREKMKKSKKESQEKCRNTLTKEDPEANTEDSKKQAGISISEVLATIVPDKLSSTGDVATMISVIQCPEQLLSDLESVARDSESATSAEFPMGEEDSEINVEDSDSDQLFMPSELAGSSKKKIMPFKPPNLAKQKCTPKPKKQETNIDFPLKTKAAVKSFKPPKKRKRKAAFGDIESDSDNDLNLPAKQPKPIILSGPVWVQCDNIGCQKWRKLADCGDPSKVPEFWKCSMNTNTERNTCSAPEEDWDVAEGSEEFVESVFVPGSIVWAKMEGYPWWPAMIEQDPDHQSFYMKRSNADSNIPVKYHVVFFDTPVSRGWIHSHSVVPFTDMDNPNESSHTSVAKKHKKPLNNAMKQALSALVNCSLKERLEKFGFNNRYMTKRKASDNDAGKKKGSREPSLVVVSSTPRNVTVETSKISASKPINVQSEE